MNIPLDRLYSYMYDLCDRYVIIYRFWPHGSKNLENIKFDDNDFNGRDLIPGTDVSTMTNLATKPLMIAHDQEPLSFESYNANAVNRFVIQRFKKSPSKDVLADPSFDTKAKLNIAAQLCNTNFRSAVEIPFNVYDQLLLCHSERNSTQVHLYEQNGFVGVYWWCHAVIARDWYRYAQHDAKLTFDANNIHQDFLVYNRAWTNTREYRLKLADLIVTKNLVDNCNMRFNPWDNNLHYTQHVFSNQDFCPTHRLENFFELNQTHSSVSGDYSAQDYGTTAFEVVLETLFDDTRYHLTEKTLRPIACGKPFILASTAGSLKYLHSYGFRTFGELIDESYDDIVDPVQRLDRITEVMQQISALSQSQKHQLWQQAHSTAEFNRKRFFSAEFADLLINEFKSNLATALAELEQNKSGKYFYWYKNLYQQYQPKNFKLGELQYIESFINTKS